MTQDYVGFCTVCNFQIKSFEGLTQCPQCGSTGVPCGYENQVQVSINVHELRILCMWAENWGNHIKSPQYETGPDVVYGIAGRLRRQLPTDMALTIADEFLQLKQMGFKIETNHPSADGIV